MAVDSYSGYTLTSLLQTTAKAEDFINKFLHSFQNVNHTVKHIAADQGVISTTKFDIIPPTLRVQLHAQGITTEVVEPYNHSRGGARVERSIRSLKELVRLAIQLVVNNPNLPALGFTQEQLLRCWGEFMHWATVVTNLTPSRADKSKSRFEVFLHRKPNMQNVRILPIGSVILINREPTTTAQLQRHGSLQLYNVPAIYVGPSLATPGAIRAVVPNSDGKTVHIFTTSRFTAASDGGGLNIYPHLARALPSLITATDTNVPARDTNAQTDQRRSVTFSDPPVAPATPNTPYDGLTPSASIPSTDPPVARATPTMPTEGQSKSISVNDDNITEPLRRSNRTRSPPSRPTEEGYLTWIIDEALAQDSDFPDVQAFYADWATHSSDDDLYYSYHLHSFVKFTS